MKKVRSLVITALSVVFLVSGCGSQNVPASDYQNVIAERDAAAAALEELNASMVSQEEYDAMVSERDAALADLDETRKNTVPKTEYDKVVEDRDALRKQIAEYEASTKTAPETAEPEEALSAPQPSAPTTPTIQFPACPLYFEDCGFTHYSIILNSFDATVESSTVELAINYIVTGITDNKNGSAFLKVACYDSQGFSIGTNYIHFSNALPGQSFSIRDTIYVDPATVRIEFLKP